MKTLVKLSNDKWSEIKESFLVMLKIKDERERERTNAMSHLSVKAKNGVTALCL